MEALEATRPGITAKVGRGEFLNRNLLRGSLLDDVNKEVEMEMKANLNKEYVTLVSDGWSDIQERPIIANVIVHGENVYVADFSIASGQKTADFCAQAVMESIQKAEEKYGLIVTSFICDNENKMKRVRQILQQWRPSLIAIGCGAHLLNLCEKKACPSLIKEGVTTIQKFFKNHHEPHMKLLELGGNNLKLEMTRGELI